MKKKVLELTLALSFVAASLSGCGSKDDGKQGQQASVQEGQQGEQGETPADTSGLALEDYTEPISYSIWCTGCSPCADISKTYLADYIMENFNIDITENFAAAVEDYTTKLSMAATTGELPDIIVGWKQHKEMFDQLAEEGKLMALDDFVATRGKEYVDTYIQDGVLDSWRAPDGKLYCLPTYSLPSNEKILSEGKVTPVILCALGIREDIFNDLNLPIPTNTDELYDTMVKIKEANLTVDGETVYPFGVQIHNASTGSMDLRCFESMFGVSSASTGVWFDEEAQEKLHIYDSPQYVEMLKYVTRLYREGLLEADIFNQSLDDIGNKMIQGRYAMGYNNPSSFTTGNTALAENVEGAEFVPIEPLFAEGVEYAPYNTADPYADYFVAINANAEDPERLLKFLEWSATDAGFMTFAYGPPGEYDGYYFWDLDENGEISIKPDMSSAEKTAEAWNGDCWFCNVLGGFVAMPINIQRDYGYLLAPEDSYLKRAVTDGYLETNYVDNLYMNKIGGALAKIQDGPIAKANGTSISKVLNEGIAKLIMEAQSDEEVETMWAEVLENANKAGYQEMKQEEFELQYDKYLELTAE